MARSAAVNKQIYTLIGPVFFKPNTDLALVALFHLRYMRGGSKAD